MEYEANALKVFENVEFGAVRTMLREGEPWFVSIDVCNALGLSNSRKAVSRLDNDEKMTVTSSDGHSGQRGGAQMLTIVNESGLYSLVLSSRKPEAKAFKRWITHEVIPSIRQTGMYMTRETMAKFLADPDNAIAMLTAYRDNLLELEKANAKIKEDEPKVLLAECIVDGDGCISVGELAKILCQNGVKTGQNRLFERLRKDGFLSERMGIDYNSPTQKSIDRGYMRIKKSTVFRGGTRIAVRTPRITGKGQLYFVNKYAKKVG